MRTFYTILSLLFILSARADSLGKFTDSSDSDIWVMSSPPALTVKVDPVYHMIDVTLLKDQDQLPTSIGVTLFDSNGDSTLLELKALENSSDDSSHRAYSGSLSPSAQSVIGFEIRIPFGTGSATILKSQDMKKLEP